jgi:hypothetical protein
MKIIRFNITKLIAIIEIVCGVILLVHEIYDFITLPTTTEIDTKYGGLVDFFKYKENTYSLLYLWIVLLFTGTSYWINKKLHWTFTQISLITLFFSVEFMYLMILTSDVIIFLIILSIFLLFLFIFLEIRLFRHKYLETIEVTNKIKLASILLGIFSYAIYFTIEYIAF